MRFVSTRGKAPAVTFSEAILQGLAPDGGLYVPREWPTYEIAAIDRNRGFAELAGTILRPFLSGDPLERELGEICRRAFDFPIAVSPLPRDTAVLELYHGPTAAFKDFGARFLAHCFEVLLTQRSSGDLRPDALTVLVATSGDTGAAVASACHRRRGIRVGVLFPRGGVSPRQERQLICWDDNVDSFAVRGTFDDCQRVVKEAFRHPEWPPAGRLSSANSINIGRLLPQAAYHAVASLWYERDSGSAAGFVVPSGNVGNAVGAFWARRMGFPIRHIAMAANANHVVPDWFGTGEWKPRPSIRTLANAMDVGDPSNMERLFHLYPEPAAMREDASSLSVDDDTIRRVIAEGPDRWDRVWCPHTATAVHFRERLDSPHWVVVATAHPSKFDSIVAPLVRQTVELPPRLAELLNRPTRVTEIDPTLDHLIASL